MAILKELNKRIIGLEFNFHPKYPLGMVANNDSHRKTFISSKGNPRGRSSVGTVLEWFPLNCIIPSMSLEKQTSPREQKLLKPTQHLYKVLETSNRHRRGASRICCVTGMSCRELQDPSFPELVITPAQGFTRSL